MILEQFTLDTFSKFYRFQIESRFLPAGNSPILSGPQHENKFAFLRQKGHGICAVYQQVKTFEIHRSADLGCSAFTTHHQSSDMT